MVDGRCTLPLPHNAVASPMTDDAAAAAGDDGEDDDILTSVNTTLKSANTGDVEFLSYKPKQYADYQLIQTEHENLPCTTAGCIADVFTITNK